jgi:hypothetical protein
MAGRDGSGGETLMVRCRGCSALFPAGLQIDRASLEAMVVTSNYRCPHCGFEAAYVKADHVPVLLRE